jgi:PKD repeat protein
VEFKETTVGGTAGQFPQTKTFTSPPPTADFQMPDTIRAGESAQFTCQSKPGNGEIVQRLWDFNHGIAEVTANPHHIYDQPGKYRITLIVWDAAGRGSRIEKTVKVLAANATMK